MIIHYFLPQTNEHKILYRLPSEIFSTVYNKHGEMISVEICLISYSLISLIPKFFHPIYLWPKAGSHCKLTVTTQVRKNLIQLNFLSL